MGFRIKNKEVIAADGVPYMWNSGDCSTTATFLTKIIAADGAADDNYGISVAVGSGRIVVGAWLDDDQGSNSGSAYIYDLNGTLIQKIIPTDGSTEFRFGTSVAVGSGRIVVGARGGVLSSLNNAGCAYIYDLNGTFIQKITAPDAEGLDQFGQKVAVGSNRIVVGAPLNNNPGTDSGSAYIYDLNGNFIKTITDFTKQIGNQFGTAIAVGAGRIVVGALYEDSPGQDAGAVYIYDLNGNLIKKITAPDAAANDYFGVSVAVGSSRIVVGASGVDIGSLTTVGSAYIFDLDGNFLKEITAFDGLQGDRFGVSVAVGSGRIVVGADNDDFGIQANRGSAYVFDIDGNFIEKISASDGADSDFYGQSVAVGAGRIVVGAYLDNTPTSNAGSAYIYSIPRVYTLHDAIEMNLGKA